MWINFWLKMHFKPVIFQKDDNRTNCIPICNKTFQNNMCRYVFVVIVGLLSALSYTVEGKKFVESDVYSSSGELLSVFRLEQEMVSHYLFDAINYWINSVLYHYLVILLILAYNINYRLVYLKSTNEKLKVRYRQFTIMLVK